MVDANTEPDGLIKTTTTFESPFAFESRTRPVILMLERKRDPAARSASSLRGSDWLVLGASETVGVGVGVGEGSAGVAVTVASGLIVSGLVVSVSATGAIFSCRRGFVVSGALGGTESEIVEVAVAFVATPAVPVDTGGPTLSSSPSTDPLTFR